MRWWMISVVALGACQPAPTPAPEPARAVIEVYQHRNGASKCVDVDGDRWKADATCCPAGFSPAGFKVEAATAYLDEEEKVQRYNYRHLVCLEDR